MSEIRKSNDTLEATLYSPSADRGWEELEVSQFAVDRNPRYIIEEDSADVYLKVTGDIGFTTFDQGVKGHSDSLDTLPYHGNEG